MVACFHEPTCGGDDITVSVAPALHLEPYGGFTVVVACFHEPTCGGYDITVSVAPAPQLEPYGNSQYSSGCLLS
jgi:hypothetical protein